MQKGQILRNDTINLICYENLVAVELNLVLLNLEVVVNLREVENTCQVERIVDIKVDVEQRLVIVVLLLFSTFQRIAQSMHLRAKLASC